LVTFQKAVLRVRNPLTKPIEIWYSLGRWLYEKKKNQLHYFAQIALKKHRRC